MSTFSRVYQFAFLAVVIAYQAEAQAQSPIFYGRVLDSTGAVIEGATIKVVPEGLATTTVLTTNERGEFAIPVEANRYTITVVAKGFSTLDQTVDVSNPGTDPRDFVMQVEGMKEMLQVTESTVSPLPSIISATKTLTPLRDVPQAVSVVTQQQVQDQLMMSIGDVVRYVPGITAIQGENNRDQVVIRGNSTSADFFVNGVRDDVQYYRDLYNLDRIEALKGPNAMVFGRGGGGGVINRVTKEAGFTPVREVIVQAGSFNDKRLTVDFGQPLTGKTAFRLNGVFEDSDSFRDYVGFKRYGASPKFTLTPGKHTTLTLGYENFRDTRVADRGIPSFQFRPVDIETSTFFGNPADSDVRAITNLGSASIEYTVGRLIVRNRLHFGDYDRFYQNFVPGAVTSDRSQVALSAYNNATHRRNVFDQTDLIYSLRSGRIRHTLLGGAELGRQRTRNFRNTGFFDNIATSMTVPLADPVTGSRVIFRQNATDADNRLKAAVTAAYVQDQINVSRYLQVLSGVRFDRFDLRYHNNRNNDELRRTDDLISPRLGVVVKPTTPVSIYGSFSISYLPSSGDQFSSLTTVTQQVKPEKFTNYEAGVKWDLDRIALTGAVYRLNRTNTRSIDPNDPTRIVQTGSQRTNGYELGLNGKVIERWTVAGGYAYQDAFVTAATTTAAAGAQVAQVPHHTFSLWNNYQVIRRVGVGLGIVSRSDMFTAIDNTVILPGYARIDAATYFPFSEHVRLQVNGENLFNRRYYVNADGNNNISPGSSRAVRVGLTGRF